MSVRRGFSYPEIAATLTIVAVAAAVSVPAWKKSVETSRTRACYETQRRIGAAVDQFRADHAGASVDLASLWTRLKAGGYISAVPRDPGSEEADSHTHYSYTKARRVSCSVHGSVFDQGR